MVTYNQASPVLLLCEPSSLVTVKRGHHRSQEVIWLIFDQREDWLKEIRGLSDVRYSKSNSRWYIPYHLDSLNRFVRLGIPYHIIGAHAAVQDKSTLKSQDTAKDLPESGRAGTYIVSNTLDALRLPLAGTKGLDIQADINISWSKDGITISLPYDAKAAAFLKQLQGSYWHPKDRIWVCKPTIYNLNQIQSRWTLLDTETLKEWKGKMRHLHRGYKIILYRNPQFPSQICIEIIGYGANHKLLKSKLAVIYHKERKCYTTHASWEHLYPIIETYRSYGFTIENRLAECMEKAVSSKPKKVEYMLSKLPQAYYSSLKKVTDVMLRTNYGYNTIRAYTYKLCALLDHTKKTDLSEVTAQEVNEYIDGLLYTGLSYSSVNTVHSAVKLYHAKVEYVEDFALDQLERPRKKKQLPQLLSAGEILKIIEHVSNVKHLAIIYMLYGAGMRKGEVLALELNDLLWDRDQICIRNGKGGKDRIIPMSKHLKEVLEVYFMRCKPATYVFESKEKGKPYSGGSISKLLHKAVRAAGITKRVTPHTLRHAFATHLLDHGTSLPKIQALLGHKDIKTTMIYTHLTNDDISNVRSPLDRILVQKRNSDNEKV